MLQRLLVPPTCSLFVDQNTLPCLSMNAMRKISVERVNILKTRSSIGLTLRFSKVFEPASSVVRSWNRQDSVNRKCSVCVVLKANMPDAYQVPTIAKRLMNPSVIKVRVNTRSELLLSARLFTISPIVPQHGKAKAMSCALPVINNGAIVAEYSLFSVNSSCAATIHFQCRLDAKEFLPEPCRQPRLSYI